MALQLKQDLPVAKKLKKLPLLLAAGSIGAVLLISMITMNKNKPTPSNDPQGMKKYLTTQTVATPDPGEVSDYGKMPAVAITDKVKLSETVDQEDKIEDASVEENPESEVVSTKTQKNAVVSDKTQQSAAVTIKEIEKEKGRKLTKKEIIEIKKSTSQNLVETGDLERQAMQSDFFFEDNAPTETEETEKGFPLGTSPAGNLSPDQEMLAKMQKELMGGIPTLPDMQQEPLKRQNMQKEKKEYLSQENTEVTNFVAIIPQKPRSPYELKAGAILPGVLIGGMNSDLPGNILGQIREDIFDTVTGHHLLIPKGTRLKGEYDSTLAYGQERILVVWTRMTLPDGRSVDLDRMPGVDMSGMAGMTGKVNRYFWRKAGSVILSSIFDAGANIAVRNKETVIQEAVKGTTERATESVGGMVEKEFNRQNTITIKAGELFNVIVHKDLIIEPY